MQLNLDLMISMVSFHHHDQTKCSEMILGLTVSFNVPNGIAKSWFSFLFFQGAGPPGYGYPGQPAQGYPPQPMSAAYQRPPQVNLLFIL